jgi:hypothetical protein
MITKTFDSINSIYLQMLGREYINRKYSNAFLGILVLLVLAIRIYSLRTPLPDRTAWKEIDYITISQNYTGNGFDFFKPTISWPAEPPRVTAMEFPAVPYLNSIMYALFGFNTITIRLTTLVAFLLIILVTFKLAEREIGQIPALFAAAMAAFIPLTNMFGNMLNTYQFAILTGLASILYMSKWVSDNMAIHMIISCCLFSLTLLMMPTELVLALPLGWLVIRKYGVKVKALKTGMIYGAAALIMPLLWYGYVYFLTKHSIDVFGVFKGHDKYQTVTMLTSKEWYALMARRFLSLLSGFPGLLITFAGFIVILLARRGWLFLFYGIAFAAFVVIVAEGNLDAPYRQFCGIPALSAFFGIGLTYLLAAIIHMTGFGANRVYNPLKPVSFCFVLVLSYFTLVNRSFIFGRSELTPIIPRDWALSEAIKKHVDPGAKIITAGTYTIHKGGNDLSPVLYYYSKTQGWTLNKEQLSLDSLKMFVDKGALLFAAENISREKELGEFVGLVKNKYALVYQDDSLGVFLFDLRQPFSRE